MDGLQSFGQWLRHRRRELDLTQDALARQVECARVTIRKLAADDIRPSRQLAESLAEQLGVPAAERHQFVQIARKDAKAQQPSQPGQLQSRRRCAPCLPRQGNAPPARRR